MKAILITAGLLTGALSSANAADKPAYKVVVNKASGVSAMKRAELSKIFLKKQRKLANGKKAQPVTRETRSAVTKKFILEIHKKKTSAFQRYWHKMIFSGRSTPPPAKTSDADVLAYVKANANAIGYVSASAKIGSDLKVVDITDVPGQQHSKKKKSPEADKAPAQ